MGLDLGPWEQGDLRGLLRVLPEGPRVVAVAEIYYPSLKDFHEIGEACFKDLPEAARAASARRLLCASLVGLQRRFLDESPEPATGGVRTAVLFGPDTFFETPMKNAAPCSLTTADPASDEGPPG